MNVTFKHWIWVYKKKSVLELSHNFSLAMENHGKNFLMPSSYAAQYVNLCCHYNSIVLKLKSKKQ